MKQELRLALAGGVFRTSARQSSAMSRVRSKGNKSTERKLQMALVRAGVRGWRLQPLGLPGKPDFVFAAARVAVFVDGCFWHGCDSCGHIPKTHSEFWSRKIKSNNLRDAVVTEALRAIGFTVLRIWEHELKDDIGGVIRRTLSVVRGDG